MLPQERRHHFPRQRRHNNHQIESGEIIGKLILLFGQHELITTDQRDARLQRTRGDSDQDKTAEGQRHLRQIQWWYGGEQQQKDGNDVNATGVCDQFEFSEETVGEDGAEAGEEVGEGEQGVVVGDGEGFSQLEVAGQVDGDDGQKNCDSFQ